METAWILGSLSSGNEKVDSVGETMLLSRLDTWGIEPARLGKVSAVGERAEEAGEAAPERSLVAMTLIDFRA